MRTVVVGTAGHVDHGKSSLVKALTGTDPDRLKEEQARGITIDLGFAHLPVGDVVLSFVDVPGHERFVKNMMAGAQGIDVVVLVVAADESVMPQTREHLAICRLLGVASGVVALTKCDLVDAETLQLVELEVQDLVRGTFLEGAPVVPCSAVTRQGLDDLVAAVRTAAQGAARRDVAGPFRMPVDRVFTLKGFGAVVTGTAAAGRVAAGDEVEILPKGGRCRVRGVQVHGAAAEAGEAGSRLALNLGGVDHHDLERGDVVTAPSSHVASATLDVAISLLPDAPEMEDLARVRVHVGTAEAIGRVRWARGQPPPPGGRAVGQVRLEQRVVARVGERFILRRYSPISTIGGGRVLHPAPHHPLRRRDAREASELEEVARSVEEGRLDDAAAYLVGCAGAAGLTDADLARLLGDSVAACGRLLAPALAAGTLRRLGDSPPLLLAAAVVAAAQERVLARLARFHAEEPLAPGLAKASLQAVTGLPESALQALLAGLEASGRVRSQRDVISLAGHAIRMSPEERAARDAIIGAHRDAGLQPPDLPAVLAATRLDAERAQRLARNLIEAGDLVRLREQMLVDAAAMAGLLADMASWLQPGRSFSVPEFKDRSGVSRKHAIPLLEYLDAQGFTRRQGEGRVWTGKVSSTAAVRADAP